MKVNKDGKIVTMKDAPMNTLEEKVQRLLDRESIMEVMHEYTRCADINDPFGMAACFTDDCISTYWLDGEGEVLYGKDGLMRFLSTFYFGQPEPPADAMDKVDVPGIVVYGAHHIHNEQMFFETPDSATVFLYMFSIQRFTTQVSDSLRWGRYELNFRRDEDSEWRIHRLRLLTIAEYAGTRQGEAFDRSWPPEMVK